MTTRNTRRLRFLTLLLLTSLACFLSPTPACADGAMGLALATFAWRPWLAYVVVTIIFEALAMGKWLRVPAGQALFCALKANFVTAILGGFFSGIACAFIGFYGNQINPNPFGRTLLLFTLFGCGSALIEAGFWPYRMNTSANREHNAFNQPIWRRQIRLSHPESRWSKTVLPCLIVHLVGVPVALVVLLIPARPYPGLEAQVFGTRVIFFEYSFDKALESYLAEHDGTLPPAHSYGELLQILKPRLGRYASDSGLWAAAYVPDYHRFDTSEMRRYPIEWNDKVSGRNLDDLGGSPVWLIRFRYKGWTHGTVLDNGGWAHASNSLRELGYN